jgi:hypothetical protein
VLVIVIVRYITRSRCASSNFYRGGRQKWRLRLNESTIVISLFHATSFNISHCPHQVVKCQGISQQVYRHLTGGLGTPGLD